MAILVFQCIVFGSMYNPVNKLHFCFRNKIHVNFTSLFSGETSE